jgi:hypothetical protein
MCQSLIVARSEGVDRALLVCDDDNAASAAVIERLGGRLREVEPSPLTFVHPARTDSTIRRVGAMVVELSELCPHGRRNRK